MAESATANMNPEDVSKLNELQNAYRKSIELWIAAIHKEEAFVAGTIHSLVRLDAWNEAVREQEKAGEQAKQAQTDYEDALRRQDFGF